MTKTCTGPCGQTLPATGEHFPWNNKARGVFRTQCRTCYDATRRKYNNRRLNAAAVDRERVSRVDTGPLRDFLRALPEFSNPNAIGDHCGVDGAILRRIWNGETAKLGLDTVDRILVGLECSPQMLPVLYPHLYEFKDR